MKTKVSEKAYILIDDLARIDLAEKTLINVGLHWQDVDTHVQLASIRRQLVSLRNTLDEKVEITEEKSGHE